MGEETYLGDTYKNRDMSINPGKIGYGAGEQQCGSSEERRMHRKEMAERFLGEMSLQLLQRLHDNGHTTAEAKSAALADASGKPGLAPGGVKSYEWHGNRLPASAWSNLATVLELAQNAGYGFSVELQELGSDTEPSQGEEQATA